MWMTKQAELRKWILRLTALETVAVSMDVDSVDPQDECLATAHLAGAGKEDPRANHPKYSETR